jgi:CheY-like chemotaxis protein
VERLETRRVMSSLAILAAADPDEAAAPVSPVNDLDPPPVLGSESGGALPQTGEAAATAPAAAPESAGHSASPAAPAGPGPAAAKKAPAHPAAKPKKAHAHPAAKPKTGHQAAPKQQAHPAAKQHKPSQPADPVVQSGGSAAAPASNKPAHPAGQPPKPVAVPKSGKPVVPKVQPHKPPPPKPKPPAHPASLPGGGNDQHSVGGAGKQVIPASPPPLLPDAGQGGAGVGKPAPGFQQTYAPSPGGASASLPPATGQAGPPADSDPGSDPGSTPDDGTGTTALSAGPSVPAGDHPVSGAGAAHDKPAQGAAIFFLSSQTADRAVATSGTDAAAAAGAGKAAPRSDVPDANRPPAGTARVSAALAAAALDLRRLGEWPPAGAEGQGALNAGPGSAGGGPALADGTAPAAGSVPDAVWAGLPGAGTTQEVGFAAHGLAGGRLAGPADASDKETLDAGYGVLLSVLLANPLTLYPGPETEQPTLLLVESDEDTRDAMTVMLFQEGYQVLAVSTGRDAWNVLRAPFAPIDIVLLDVHLPDINGVQLCRRLRDAFPNMPVFAWVPPSASAESAQLRQLGVQHWAGRSEELAELVGTVRAFLRGGPTPEA